MRKIIQCVALGITLGIVGCAKKNSSVSTNLDADDAVRFYGTNMTAEQERELLTQRVYYFDYDSFEVQNKDIMAVYAHARKMLNNSNARIRLEGHTDKRGSREYNIGLGEKRAKAVANLLLLKGISSERIAVVSYGKEKPAVSGDGESAFSQNRRVELIYEQE